MNPRILLIEKIQELYHVKKQLYTCVPDLLPVVSQSSFHEYLVHKHHVLNRQLANLDTVFDMIMIPHAYEGSGLMDALIKKLKDVAAEASCDSRNIDFSLLKVLEQINYYETVACKNALEYASGFNNMVLLNTFDNLYKSELAEESKIGGIKSGMHQQGQYVYQAIAG